MDATTTVIVVLIFVATIFTSLGGNQGYTQPSSVPQKEAVASLAMPAVPDPTYYGTIGVNPREAILAYVSRYRRDEQAEEITRGIMRSSKQYDVNPKLVAALMARESRFNPRAISSSGAVGLGQLLPSTCKTVGVSNPYDIAQNLKGTARDLSYLMGRFSKYKQKVTFALAGYLEGPNAVERKLGYKPHTASYVRDILNIYYKI